jgi:hypothetical protein
MRFHQMDRTEIVALCVGMAIGCGTVPGTARGSVRQIASLPRVGGIYEALAASPRTLVVSALDGIEVYSSGPDGWAGAGAPASLLIAPGASIGAQVATDGSVVLANTTTMATSGFPIQSVSTEDVYQEPARGWSGTVAAAATLSTGTDAYITDAVIDGQTIAADATDGAIYVYQEPAGGWSGTVTASARLVDASVRQSPFGGLSIQDGAIFSPTDHTRRGDFDIFTKPSSGWAGTIAPSGSFAANSGPKTPIEYGAGFGGGVMAALGPNRSVGILPIPRSDTTRRPTPLAKLSFPSELADAPTRVLLSSSYAVFSTEDDGDATSGDRSQISVISKPSGGWSGTLTAARPIVRACDFAAIALHGSTLFVEDRAGPVRVLQLHGRQRGRQITTHALAETGPSCGNPNP